MPELPDVDVYVAALHHSITGKTLEAIRLNSPVLLRTVAPPLTAASGKRVVLALEEDLLLAIHLMIAGRLHWKPKGTRKRASLHVVHGEHDLAALSRGGTCTPDPEACAH